MTKIFLAEDEVYALQALRQKILDLGGDYEVVGTAGSGSEALKALQRVSADILLTDIRMPDMDGIALIEALKAQNNPIVPVIISGYQEFEYAQQALRLGVKDYLLKPVVPQHLQNCLEHCEEILAQRRSSENVVSILIEGNAVALHVSQDVQDFLVAYLIAANPLTDFENIVHPSVSRFASEMVEELFAAHFASHCRPQCFDGFFSNEKAVILSGMRGEDDDAARHALLLTAQKLAQRTGHAVTLFYAYCPGRGQLGTTVHRCRKGAVRSAALGKTTVADRLPEPEARPANIAEFSQLLVMLLRQDETELLRSNLRRLLAEWQKAGRSLTAVQGDLAALLGAVRGSFSDKVSYPSSSLFFVENMMCFSSSFDELAENFYQLLTELFRASNLRAARPVTTSEELVEQIDEYFRKNLSSDITLQTLSEEFSLSKVYLCRIFKKQKDMTPIDYFTRLKIDRAKELLLRFPSMSLRDISDSLGFSDMYYFSKVFKRITGLAPSEFRHQ